MAHPLFARLDRQLELVRRELGNVSEADRRFRALRKLAASGGKGAGLYHEWSHCASLADGMAAIYTGLESVLEAIGNEIDEYVPRGEGSHAVLLDGMAIAVRGVRPAVLSEATQRLMHEARKFRHVVRHKYALELRRTDVTRNLALARKLVPAFGRDYRRFAGLMLAAGPSQRGARKPRRSRRGK
jgi:hypothetical protein